MSWATTKDQYRLHYEEAGSGTPILFVHEFAGDWRAWEPQMRHFARRHRCITYSARGYPPSDIPQDVSAYSQATAVQDALAVLDAAGVDRAHIVGLSMGGFATIHFGLTAPERALSLTVAGAGYATEKSTQEFYRALSRETAQKFDTIGAKALAETYALGATRVQLQNKDPRGWAEFLQYMSEHSALGSALTLKNYQALRPSLYDYAGRLRDIDVPVLLAVGDEDDPVIEANIYLKRTMPRAGLWIHPATGHGLNIEEPDEFNRRLAEFWGAVERGTWRRRDPRANPHQSVFMGDKPEKGDGR